MKQQLNEIKKMQRIAGLITESEYQESLNEEQYAEPMIMIQNIVDNFFDGGIDAEAAMTRIEKILQGNYEDYEDENGEDSLDESHESDKAVMNILNRNGIDDNYFKSMGGLEIEMGGSEWMDTLSDLTGKEAYEDEFDEQDDTKISNFMSAIRSLGIKFV